MFYKPSSPYFTTFFKIAMNLSPLFRTTGGRILTIAKDWRHIRIELKRNIWSRNYVNTIFGGSLFAAADPFYMIMFMYILDRKEYVVWDKSASIKFIAPGTKTLFTDFIITNEHIETVKAAVAVHGFTTIELLTEWKDADGKVYSHILRTVYIASKVHYEKRNLEKTALR